MPQKRPKVKRIKEKTVDDAYSLYIRKRDGFCQYPLRDSKDYHSSQLQNSHYYGRGCRSVRFDDENCDAMCGRHHQFLEERKNKEYLDWKTKQLGAKKFLALKKRAYQTKQWTQKEYQELLTKYKTPLI